MCYVPITTHLFITFTFELDSKVISKTLPQLQQQQIDAMHLSKDVIGICILMISNYETKYVPLVPNYCTMQN